LIDAELLRLGSFIHSFEICIHIEQREPTALHDTYIQPEMIFPEEREELSRRNVHPMKRERLVVDAAARGKRNRDFD